MSNNNAFDTGMYIIDKEYRIVNFNQNTKEMYPEIHLGDVCYKTLGLQDEPCSACPLCENDITFYSEPRKEWITASAAKLNYPECGECYSIYFKRQLSSGGTKREQIRFAKIDKSISELKETLGQECAIGAYCESGSPIFFANPQMIQLLEYDSLDEFMERIDGMVMNLIHPADRAQVRVDAAKAQKVGDVYESSFRMLKKDGTWIWLIAKGKIIETDNGRWATVTVCTDISGFIRHHENLKQENEELLIKEIQAESIMLTIPGAYHRCGMGEGYPFLYISDSFQEIVGWTKEEIETLFDNKFINLVWEEDLHLFDGLVDQIENKGQGSSIYRLKRKDGGYRWIQDSTMLVNVDEDSFYQCTLSDITSYIDELEDAKQRAEVSNRAKSTFLFNASHDIRTPMNAIQGFTQMLKQNPDDGQFVREIIAKIETSSDTLMKLLNDVLEVSRIESGKEEINLKVMNLHEHGERLKMMFKQEIESAGIVFELESAIQNVFVWGDELKITQIGMNMLSNARKFTQAGGKITFGIEQMHCQEDGYGIYRFYVKDTGIGMSEEFQKKAFEQFERERTTTDSGVIGSGLGMSIIKKLVDLMDGQTTLQSELGKGTEIAAELKLRISDENENVQEVHQENDIELAGRKILLVEDNEFNREIARFILEKMGIIVDEVENGFAAVNKLLNSDVDSYDMVLMDIQMPIMNGYVATQEIRCIQNKAIANIPIVAMTANAFQEDKERCMEAGMDGHISKPIDAEKLVKEIGRILHK